MGQTHTLSVKLDLKATPLCVVLTVLDAIRNLSDNPFPPQSKRLTGREGWRLRVGRYRVIYTLGAGEITLFVVKIPHRKKKSTYDFLQNEANSTLSQQMHDNASYQLNCAGETSNA
jgi:mRNA-degrading endonuclease RelE of RelBE toxin-antitoxin system